MMGNPVSIARCLRTLVAAAALVSIPMVSVAQGSATLEQRLNRLERLLASESLLKLFQTVENLQQEVRDLRGEIEVQTHQMSELRRRQTELYLDIDKRMQRLETGQFPRPRSGGTGAPSAADGAGGNVANRAAQGTQTQNLPPAGSAATGTLGRRGANTSSAAGAASVTGASKTGPTQGANPNATAIVATGVPRQPVGQSGAATAAGASGASSGAASTGAAGLAGASPNSSQVASASVPARASSAQAPTPSVSAGSSGTSASGSAGEPTDPVAEQKAYKDAFGLLKSGRYEDAATAFQDFLTAYGQGEFADNAQYWLGETFYVTRQFDLALAEFQTLVMQHPKSQKLTHAMLKIGYIHDELGQPAEARQALGQLIERFPKTTAAGLAKKRLQRLRSQ